MTATAKRRTPQSVLLQKKLDERDLMLPGALHTFPELTKTERFVAMMIASGEDRSAIDRRKRLGISPGTYARHRENIMRTLGLHNDVQLALLAVRRGYLQPFEIQITGCRVGHSDPHVELVVETTVGEMRLTQRGDVEALMEVATTVLSLRRETR